MSWAKSDLSVRDRPPLVGARNASSLGLHMARGMFRCNGVKAVLR